jgi:hypothetical protein
MKFTTLIYLTAAATLSAACPDSAGAGAAYRELWRAQSRQTPVDHVFAVITNEDENFVVSHNIGQDGQLVRNLFYLHLVPS